MVRPSALPPAGAPCSALPVLLTGIAAISTAAVLIRLCEAPPLVVAAWRLGLAAAVLLPLELARARRLPAWGALGGCALSGLFLALHFAAWIASLGLTSVSSSVVLVTTSPIFVGLASRWLLGEPLARRTAWGIAMGTAGTVVVAWGDFGTGSAPLLGDGLALLGALAASAYLLTGRAVRRSTAVGTYAAWTYGCAAALLVAASLSLGLPLAPYPAPTVRAMLLLALLPQLVGHTALNWALGHLPAATVAVVILGEPVGASLLALALLGEVPSAATLAGGGLILGGIWLALARSPTRPR